MRFKALPYFMIGIFLISIFAHFGQLVHAAPVPQSTVTSVCYQPGLNCFQSSTITCQTLNPLEAPRPIGTPVGNENICTALGATVQKDNQEMDSSGDYYAIDLFTYALNGTSGPAILDAPVSFPYVWAMSINAQINFPGSVVGLKYAPLSAQSGQSWNIAFCAQGSVACLSLGGVAPSQTLNLNTNGVGTSQITNTWQVDTLVPAFSNMMGHEADYGIIVEVNEGVTFTLGLSFSVTFQYYGDSSCTLLGEYCRSQFGPMTASLNVPDPDFSLSGPSSVSIAPCQTTTATVTATSQSTFYGIVYFTDNLPSGFTSSFSPTSVQIGGGSSASTTYSFTTPCNAKGSYEWNVNGATVAGTNLQHSWVMTNSPDFSIFANPTSITETGSPSQCATFHVTYQSLGYQGNFWVASGTTPDIGSSMQIQWQLPNGATFYNPVSITNSGSFNALLIVWGDRTVIDGHTYQVTIWGNGGHYLGDPSGPSHSISASLTFSSNYIGCGASGGGAGGGKPN